MATTRETTTQTLPLNSGAAIPMVGLAADDGRARDGWAWDARRMSRPGWRNWCGLAVLVVGAWGCPSDPRPREDSATGMDAGARPVVDAGTAVGSTLGDSDGTEQQPPTTGRAAARAWLAAGAWRRWRCETSTHPATGLSPHGNHRICNNDVLVGAPAGAPWPVGAASVKELHDPRDPSQIVGHAYYLKVAEGTDGSNWFWFESVRPGFALDPPAPTDPDGTVAVGRGDRGAARAICVGCHARSGDNDSGLLGYGDFVYTRVPAPSP